MVYNSREFRYWDNVSLSYNFRISQVAIKQGSNIFTHGSTTMQQIKREKNHARVTRECEIVRGDVSERNKATES